MIQNPGFLPDHPQNLITCSLCHAGHTLKISERSVHNFLSYLVHTYRQTNKNRQNITFLAEVNIMVSLGHFKIPNWISDLLINVTILRSICHTRWTVTSRSLVLSLQSLVLSDRRERCLTVFGSWCRCSCPRADGAFDLTFWWRRSSSPLCRHTRARCRICSWWTNRSAGTWVG